MVLDYAKKVKKKTIIKSPTSSVSLQKKQMKSQRAYQRNQLKKKLVQEAVEEYEESKLELPENH